MSKESPAVREAAAPDRPPGGAQMLAAALICFASFGLLYGLTSRANLQLSDEVAVFATGISWINDGELAIDELQGLQNAENIGAPM